MAWSANLNGWNSSRQIAFDGKALRGSFDTASAKKRCITADLHFEEADKGHGRITERKYDVIKVDSTNLPQITEWKGLQAIGRVETTSLRNGWETFESRYYLLSYCSAQAFAVAARGHWGEENLLHWTLDVTFGEDASRKRKDNAPKNYSFIRKFALNVLRQFKGKLSIPLAHIKANANSEYLKTMLTQAGFASQT